MAVVGPLEPLADQGRAGNVYRFVAAQADDPTSAKAMTLKTYGATEAGAEHARHEWNALVRLHRERCAVPPPHFVEPDMTAFACPVVAMDYIPGESLWSTLQETPGSQRTRLLGEFVRTLVALHRIQPSTLRRPAPEGEPLDSLGQEISEIRRDCEGLHAPGMVGVADWLQENRKSVHPATDVIQHRDYHPWNVLVGPDRDLWFVDWNWGVGDPRFDVAWTCSLLARSGYDDISTFVKNDYVRQSGNPLESSSYFEVLATIRWMLNVLLPSRSDAPKGDAALQDFRDFLVGPIEQAVRTIRTNTGLHIEVAL